MPIWNVSASSFGATENLISGGNLSIGLFLGFVSSSIPKALAAASCSWSSLCCSGSMPSCCLSFNNFSALSADLSATSSLSISALCTCLSSRVCAKLPSLIALYKGLPLTLTLMIN